MERQRPTVGINREYNYHPAFHGEIFSILEERFTLQEFPVMNFSEALIRSPKGSFLSKQVFSSGKFKGEADLLFSPHILLANNSNWVIELEHPYWLFTDHYANVDPNSTSFKLRRWVAEKWVSRQNCRSVIAWSDVSRGMLTDFLGEKLSEKISVICPMVVPPIEIIRQPSDNVTLLFVMPNKPFEEQRKGKDVALAVLRAVRSNQRVKMVFIGYLSDKEREEFGGQIEHHTHVERGRMMSEIYPRSDVLLFPSRADTFGAVIIESQSTGVIPVATCGRSVFSTPELIRDGENGFLIRNKESRGEELDFGEVDIQRFCEIVRLLIGNDELRKGLSYQSREKFIKSKHNPNNQREIVISLFLHFMQIRK